MSAEDGKMKRREIWRHNSYLGHVAMARRNILNLESAPTVTPAAADIAREILPLLDRLSAALKTRKE